MCIWSPFWEYSCIIPSVWHWWFESIGVFHSQQCSSKYFRAIKMATVQWKVIRIFVLLTAVVILVKGLVRKLPEPFKTHDISSSSVTTEDEEAMVQHPPCSFNGLCTCSNAGPSDFGHVTCHGFILGNIPLPLNSSRIFMLSLKGNGLQVLQEKRLVGSGLWRLEIRKNELSQLASESLMGLGKSLWELDLQDNELTRIPTAALAHLGKLRLLDLSCNLIGNVHSQDFGRMHEYLTELNLGGNELTFLTEDAFASLPKLEHLNLSSNGMHFMHPLAFRSISSTLQTLILADNLFTAIPFTSLPPPIRLKYLDLSRNRIISTTLHDPNNQHSEMNLNHKISVQQLNLNYNQIRFLPPFAFKNFQFSLSILSITNNGLEAIENDTFSSMQIESLDLSHGFLSTIPINCFRGLKNTLRQLDIRFNNLTMLEPEILSNFQMLNELHLDENNMRFTIPQELFIQIGIQRLSIIGDVAFTSTVTQTGPQNYSVPTRGHQGQPGHPGYPTQPQPVVRIVANKPMQILKHLPNLRHLNVTSVTTSGVLTQDLWEGFNLSLQSLRISFSRLHSIGNRAFVHLPNLKTLEISHCSGNRIGRIESDSLDDIGHSLQKLHIVDCLKIKLLNRFLFQKLDALQILDLSNNEITGLEDGVFARKNKLTFVNFRFNQISALRQGMFEWKDAPNLKRVLLSFNRIGIIPTSLFRRLDSLEYVELNENLIQVIETRAFEDLPNLLHINLAGNVISQLDDEMFLNLPRLRILDLSHNRLKALNSFAFEQVGTLSNCRFDLSYNQISHLSPMTTQPGQNGASLFSSFHNSLSVEKLDLSYNNLSYISPLFLSSGFSSLIDLNLNHNRLRNITQGQLTGLRNLQRFSANDNQLDSIEFDAFHDTKLMQSVSLNRNLLRDIPADLFQDLNKMRLFSVSGNNLRTFPDSVFKDTPLEYLDVQRNNFGRFPDSALSKASKTLRHLDLSMNDISYIAPDQLQHFSSSSLTTSNCISETSRYLKRSK